MQFLSQPIVYSSIAWLFFFQRPGSCRLSEALLLHSFWDSISPTSSLHHRFHIQSEWGVNGLFALAAQSNLLLPCSCFFLLFSLFLFLTESPSSFFGFSAPPCFSNTKEMVKIFSSFCQSKQSEDHARPSALRLHWGSWFRSGNLQEPELFPKNVCVFQPPTRFFKDQPTP